MSNTRWSPATCAALAKARAPKSTPPARRRGPYTSTSAQQTDASTQRAATITEANARRRAALDAQRTKLEDKLTLHYRRGDDAAYENTWAKVAHVDALIFAGERDGRW